MNSLAEEGHSKSAQIPNFPFGALKLARKIGLRLISPPFSNRSRPHAGHMLVSRLAGDQSRRCGGKSGLLKILKYGAIIWIVLSIIAFPFYWPFIRMLWVFIPNIPTADYDPPSSVVEARLQDIDYLSRLTEYDRAFGDAARLDFANKIEDMSCLLYTSPSPRDS